jgi:hypothetical protein
LQAAQGAYLIALERMHRGRAALAPADVQTAGVQFDLVPLQIDQLRGAQTVAICEQDHGCVPVTVAAVLARGVDQLLDLGAGEIAPGASD